MTIYEKLTNIQNELKVKKTRYNKFGKYYYRAAEDILEAVKPLASKYDAAVFIDEELIDGMTIKSTAVITDGENTISSSAIVGVEKAGGMALPQAYGAASSYGKKYALGNLLLIDDTQDADATNTHGKSMAQQVSQLEKATTKIKKSKPQINTDNIDKAMDFLARGGKLETLKAKYDIAPDVIKTLGG